MSASSESLTLQTQMHYCMFSLVFNLILEYRKVLVKYVADPYLICILCYVQMFRSMRNYLQLIFSYANQI
jgi:hypothetical protein